MKIIDVLIERIKDLSGKPCEFGFINDYIIENSTVLAEEKFILIPEQLESKTISLNHRKEKYRRIKVFYLTFNNIEDNSKSIFFWLETFLDNLTKDREILKHIINMDYLYNATNEKSENEQSVGTVTFEINLDIKER